MDESNRLPEAVVAVLKKDQRILVIKRGPDVLMPGYWTLPSGRIEPGESHEEALVREVEEELGLRVRPIARVWQCPTDDGDFVLHWWTVASVSDELRPHPGEIAEVRWVTPDEFLDLHPTFVGDHEFFTQVLPRLDLT